MRFTGGSRVRYRAEFWGGPLDGEIRPLASLPEVLEVFYGPERVVTDEVTYRRAQDGKANPWRYVFVSQTPKQAQFDLPEPEWHEGCTGCWRTAWH